MVNHPLAISSNFSRRKQALLPALPRTINPTLVGILCLAAILATEMNDVDGAALPTDQGTVHSAGVPLPSGQDLRTGLDMTVSTILSRPIFAVDRHPFLSVSTAAKAVTEPPVKLVGTIVSNRARIAFLELAGKQIALVVGDKVGDARITEIGEAGIRLLSGDGRTDDVRLSWGTVIEPTPRPPQLEASHLAFHLEK